MKCSPTIQVARRKEGSALPVIFILMVMVSTLYLFAIDRTNSERNHVLAFYYENVALDLAESGINMAVAKLQKGIIPTTDTTHLGEFRGLAGSFRIEVRRLGNNLYQIISVSQLKDKKKHIKYSSRIVANGRIIFKTSGQVFKLEDWQEPHKK